MTRMETQRLILRTFAPEDVDDVYDYARDPSVGPNAGWKPHESRIESFCIVAGFIRGGEVWAIEHRRDGRVIGSIGLHKGRDRSGEDCRTMGYVLARPYWGEGLCTEAARAVLRCGFDEMGLAVVAIAHYTDNERSRRVIEKCGFTPEGVMRRARTLYNGAVKDEAFYSMLREEYDALKAEGRL